MKKASKIFIYFLLFVDLLLGWFAYKRHFYYFGETGKYVTVWKRIGGRCLIIPGKYYGITKPNDYIEIGNVDNITLYWSSELPNSFIARDEGYKFNINSNNNVFIKYDDNKEHFHQILYLENAQKRRDIKPNAELLNLSIREPYATDKKGNKS